MLEIEKELKFENGERRNFERILILSVFVLALTATSQGYCAGEELKEMDLMTNNVMNTIFSPWVKKTALVFGGGMGLFKAYAAGSIQPLLLWGGLGLAVNFVPKVVEIIAKM